MQQGFNAEHLSDSLTSVNIEMVTRRKNLTNQCGYALVAIISILMIIGAVATGGISLSTKTERLAGNAIQRSRSFQAADAAVSLGEKQVEELMFQRVFADISASNGIFTRDHRDEQWWRNASAEGEHVVDPSAILGVVTPPRYAIEQVGDYVADGGTGVVNLDIGSGAYGRLTTGGREFLLFSVESHGKGSFDAVDTVVESTVSFSY